MNITVIGAGNVGTQLAVHCAEKKHRVIMFTSKPDAINNELVIIDENNKQLHKGSIAHATNDEMLAFQEADVIFVTMPAYLMNKNANRILPFVRNGMKICLVPGTGGGECAFKECIEKGAIVFGLQRVPSVARLVEYGHIVRAVGYRNELFISAIPNKYSMECSILIEELIDLNSSPLPNYLNITLTPSNPILHTTRLKILFNDYKKGTIYLRNPYFYEEWDDASSELLLACDDEIQDICSALDFVDLSFVKSLRSHYESADVQSLTKKLSSILGFKGIKSPMKEEGDGLIPDLASRYFKADFSYGLTILDQIADMVGVAAPNIKDTLEWYLKLSGDTEVFDFSDYGIKSLEDFKLFYLL